MGEGVFFTAMNQGKERNVPFLIIASTNKGKINEFKKFLSEFPVIVIGQPKELVVDETGSTFVENARLKAIAAAQFSGSIALADDSGLRVEALNGAPGIYSSRYANCDSERVSKLLKELKFAENRKALFCAALCLASPNGEVLLEVEGQCNGLITKEPRGELGFGYDPIFEVDGTGLTFAEMDPSQKNHVGHRGLALDALKPGLNMIFNSVECNSKVFH